MCDFLIEINKENNYHNNWNWARFEWMYEHPLTNKELLNEMGELEPIRLVGVRLDNLTENKCIQFSIFDSNEELEKNDKLQKVLDNIKEKYGQDLKVNKQ